MPIYQRSSPIGMLTDDTKTQVAAAITEAHVGATGAPRNSRSLGVEVVVVEGHVHEHAPRHRVQRWLRTPALNPLSRQACDACRSARRLGPARRAARRLSPQRLAI
jgi:phenylpyruvate tautomerase PptA (4-oxalocrotonate tautomerase family)